MEQFIKYVGLDVHGKTIAVAVADSESGEVRFIGEIVNTSEAVAKLVKQLKTRGAQLSFCYEAGPCGYGIYRQLKALGQCLVCCLQSAVVPARGEAGVSRPTGRACRTGNRCIGFRGSGPSPFHHLIKEKLKVKLAGLGPSLRWDDEF